MKIAEISLLNRVKTGVDRLNQPIYTPTEKKLVARRIPISQTEYFQAGQVGISAEFCFIISLFDYSGETMIKYEGKNYRIYRKYERNDNELEIYVEYASGLNSEEEET